jgi:hypothetical protein
MEESVYLMSKEEKAEGVDQSETRNSSKSERISPPS